MRRILFALALAVLAGWTITAWAVPAVAATRRRAEQSPRPSPASEARSWRPAGRGPHELRSWGGGAASKSGAVAPPSDFGPISQLAERVDHRYNSMKTLEARFVEIYSEGNQSRTESGMLYLSKPGRMRWQYEEPQKKLFLVDGHHVWLYVDGDRQAQRSDLKSNDDLKTPLRFLLGHTHLKKELSGLSYGGLNPLHPGDVVIRGVPTRMTDTYREVILEVTPDDTIDRIVIRGVDGSQTDIRLSGIQANARMVESLFHFAPPPGVTVVAGTAQ